MILMEDQASAANLDRELEAMAQRLNLPNIDEAT